MLAEIAIEFLVLTKYLIYKNLFYYSNPKSIVNIRPLAKIASNENFSSKSNEIAIAREKRQ
jgi:hypothetical protein